MQDVRAQRRLAAILVADVVGYSRLMGLDEAGTLRQIKAARREVVDPNIRACRGRVVKTTGDGILIEFPSAVEAVRCAVAVQRAMGERNAETPADRRIEFRVGVHQGDIVGDGDDIFGDGVNVAARLETLSDAGGVCVSGRVHEDLAGKLDLPFEDHGEQQVKNIARPVRVFGLGRETITSLAPPPVEDLSAMPDGAAAAGARRQWTRWGGAVAALLVLAGVAGWLVLHRDGAPGLTASEPSAAARTGARGPAIAVLAFDNLSGDPSLNAFADGLSEQLIADLSAFGVYDVPARNTTFVYKGKAVDVPEIGRKLGAQYVVEGSVRRVAEKIGVTAQLIDAGAGAHVWAHSYEQPTASSSPGAIQDDLAHQIAAGIGDLGAGAIGRNEIAQAREKPPEALTSLQCLVEGQNAIGSPDPKQIARARACLEGTVKRDPTFGDAWSALAGVLIMQRWSGYGLPPPEADDIDKRAELIPRAMEAAQKGVKLAPDRASTHFSLAQAYFVACQADRMRVEAEKVIALNPNDAVALAELGNWLAYAGDWDYGRQLAEKAIELAGPSAQGWWWWATAKGYYHKGDYAKANEYFLRAYAPGSWLDELHVVFTLPYLGRTEEAHARIPELMKLKPDISVRVADQYYKMWCFDADFREKMAKALRMAGLREKSDETTAPPTEAAAHASQP